jgi:type IV secretory pathway VirJ component
MILLIVFGNVADVCPWAIQWWAAQETSGVGLVLIMGIKKRAVLFGWLKKGKNGFQNW